MEKFSVTVSEAQNKLTFKPGDPEADLDTDNLDQGDTIVNTWVTVSSCVMDEISEDSITIQTDAPGKLSDKVDGNVPLLIVIVNESVTWKP